MYTAKNYSEIELHVQAFRSWIPFSYQPKSQLQNPSLGVGQI